MGDMYMSIILLGETHSSVLIHLFAIVSNLVFYAQSVCYSLCMTVACIVNYCQTLYPFLRLH